LKGKKHVCSVECPYCAKVIDILKETEVITPAVKAEKKETYVAEKSVQTTLSIGQ
jgi:glutaredoxin